MTAETQTQKTAQPGRRAQRTDEPVDAGTLSADIDAAQDRAITGRHLLRHQAEPRGEVSPCRKGGAIADCRQVATRLGSGFEVTVACAPKPST
jgi:hypothetical protein